MKRLDFVSTLTIACLTLLLPCMASAELVDFYAGANAPQVVGNVISSGTGAGWVELNTETNNIEWSFIVSDLTSPATGAHFHGPAAPGFNAAAQVSLDTSSNIITGSAVITSAQAADLLNDLWYFQVHTDAYPSGEIRGQIIKMIPEPATIALLGAGGLALLRRRRRP